MNARKTKALQARGWEVGSFDEFLNLTKKEKKRIKSLLAENHKVISLIKNRKSKVKNS